IGGSTPEAAERAVKLYRSFCKAELVTTNTRTAEMSKLVENSFRDVNIAFANELSMITDELGIDVWEVIELAHRHQRMNSVQPGPGVGGHCIAPQRWCTDAAAADSATLSLNAREINASKPECVISQIQAAACDVEQQTRRPPVIVALRLAFKPNIDE